MKLASLSDIHLDGYAKASNKPLQQVISDTIDALSTLDFEILIIAGDISNNMLLSLEIIEQFQQELNKNVYFIPGNHDLYSIENHLSTHEIYQLALKHPQCFLNKGLILDDRIQLIGHIGWYDYSYADTHRFSLSEFEKGEFGQSRWKDKEYIDFQKSDFDLTQQFNQELHQLYDDSFDRHILVTHMINHPKFRVDPILNDQWSFFNGFLGSKATNELIYELSPTIAICGHVHYRFNFQSMKTRFVCACLGNLSEWPYLSTLKPNDLQTQIKDATYLFEL